MNWQQKCKCGHTLAVHGGGADAGSCNAEGCDCMTFKAGKHGTGKKKNRKK